VGDIPKLRALDANDYFWNKRCIHEGADQHDNALDNPRAIVRKWVALTIVL